MASVGPTGARPGGEGVEGHAAVAARADRVGGVPGARAEIVGAVVVGGEGCTPVRPGRPQSPSGPSTAGPPPPAREPPARRPIAARAASRSGSILRTVPARRAVARPQGSSRRRRTAPPATRTPGLRCERITAGGVPLPRLARGDSGVGAALLVGRCGRQCHVTGSPPGRLGPRACDPRGSPGPDPGPARAEAAPSPDSPPSTPGSASAPPPKCLREPEHPAVDSVSSPP